jgi:putative SOS response-associated peptidase YedK
MCGRYASARSVQDLAEAFGIGGDDVDGVADPDWNIAPTKPVTVVVERSGRRVLGTMRWGLVPSWASDPSIGSRLINARLETVHDKPAFRDALVARRCLLPADGWYEWAERPDGNRQPHYLTSPDGSVLALAGLWERWQDAEGRLLVTTTIITGPAPPDLRGIHDRAPVVIPREDWAFWLDPQSPAASVLMPTQSGVVRAHPVGPDVGDVRRNGPELTVPVEVPEQPTLF